MTHTPTTAVSTLSLHDALPIFVLGPDGPGSQEPRCTVGDAFLRHDHRRSRIRQHVAHAVLRVRGIERDRKSTRLNSSHPSISYAVFCLKQKNARRSGPQTAYIQ